MGILDYLCPCKAAVAPRCLCRPVFLVLVCLPGIRLAASAETAAGLRVVGQFGGPVQAVAYDGKYAYVGVGPKLAVLDVSDPKIPREVGITPAFPHLVEGIAISGRYSYVAAADAGIRVVDVTEVARPREVGAWDTRGYTRGVAVQGSFAYVADGPYGLRILDVARPTAPREVGAAYVTSYAFDVAAAGRYVYVAAGGTGLLVVDVSDPRQPVEIAALDTPGYAFHLAIAGDTLYLADGWEGVAVVSIADPRRPVETGRYKTSGWALGVAWMDGRLLVADAFRGVRVLEPKGPGMLREIGAYEAPGCHMRRVLTAGGMALVVDRNWGLLVTDLRDPARPLLLASYSPPSDVWAVAVSGRFAYVCAGYRGLRVMDVSDPERPRLVGVYDPDGDAEVVAVSGNFAFLGVRGGKPGAGLHILDVTNPGSPKKVGYYPIFPDLHAPYYPDPQPHAPGVGRYQGVPRDIEVVDGVVYIADEFGLVMLDVNNPSEPVLLGRLVFETGGCAMGVTISGQRAYVATESVGLVIVDITDRRKPRVIGIERTAEHAQDVELAGNYALVTNLYWRRLDVIDISDPNRPRAVGRYVTSDNPMGITVSGKSALLGDGAGGLHLLDISDPTRPTLVAVHRSAGFARKAAVAGRFVYLADGTGGLVILESSGEPMALERRVATRGRWSAPPPLLLPPAVAYHRLSARRGQPVPEVATEPASSMPPASERAYNEGAAAPEPVTSHDCMVTNVSDAGPGSLRWCIENATPGSRVTFDPAVFPPSKPARIVLERELPPLAVGNVTIDGSNAGVILEGIRLPRGSRGLLVVSDSNAVLGLQFWNIPGDAIVIRGRAQRNRIGGDRNRGSGPMGEGNLFIANLRGVVIEGADVQENLVVGNWFGLDAHGAWMPNRGSCIVIAGGARRNRVGGRSPGERNVVAGCDSSRAVLLMGQGTSGNVVSGNYFGLDPTGRRRTLPESCGTYNWVGLAWGARDNVVGGLGPGEGNVISGACGPNVSIDGVGTVGNLIAGNYIGTDATGSVGMGHSFFGIWIDFGAQGNIIRNNVISGNGGAGVAITARGCEFNSIVGNIIGVNSAGREPVANDGGVFLSLGAKFNRVGGSSTADRNIISGNRLNNVLIGAYDDEGNLVLGNYVGTDVAGLRPMGGEVTNYFSGILLQGKPRGTFIGGTGPGDGNLVAGNAGPAIKLEGSGVQHVFVAGNRVGLTADGATALPNREGIQLWRATRNTIQGNLIAHNGAYGVRIDNGAFNIIRRNIIYDNENRGVIVQYLPPEFSPPMPSLLAASMTGAWGSACGGCEVELYSDVAAQGRYFEGSTIADSLGRFVFRKPAGWTGPNLVALATDLAGTSSEFSAPLAPSQTAGPIVNVSAASYQPHGVSPESIVAAFGTDLAVRTEAADSSPLPTSLAGTTVTVRDALGTERPAGLYFVAPSQVNYVLPAGTSVGFATITVTNAQGRRFTDIVEVHRVSPALFSASGTGSGLAAGLVLRVCPDGSQFYASTTEPVDLGSESDQVYLLLFGTGIRWRASLSTVNVRIGGLSVPVLYAGPQSQFPGLDQLNLLLPHVLRGRGSVEVELTVDSRVANAVALFIR